MNSRCIYYVEGPCEEQLVNALKLMPSKLLPGKVKVYNPVQKLIPKSEMLGFKPGTVVVLVFDTDTPETKFLERNIELIKKYCSKNLKKLLNYRKIWNLQKVPATLYGDISKIAKLVFDTICDDNRSTTNIETYCKKPECWEIVRKKQIAISSEALKEMISQADEKTIENEAKQEQKIVNGLNNEISIFTKGSQYWQGLRQRGQNQGVMTYADVKALDDAINYCNGKYFELSKKQIKSIQEVVAKLKENMIE